MNKELRKILRNLPGREMYVGKPWAKPGEVIEFDYGGEAVSAVVWSDGSLPRSVWVTHGGTFVEVVTPTKAQAKARKNDMPFAINVRGKD